MKKLDVPYFPQQQETDCMAACLKMVMDYHNVVEDYNDMLNAFSFYEVGLSLPQIGKYALEKGFRTEIDTLNPYIFNAKDIGRSQSEIRKKIAEMSIQNEQFDMIRHHFLGYMDQGGKLSPTIPRKETIINEILENKPVINMMATRVIHAHKPGYNFHSCVIYGFDENNFLMLDPALPENSGGHHVIDQDLAMFAMHVIGYADFDNASILKITP